MKRLFLLFILLLILSAGICACSRPAGDNTQSISSDQELYAVADNISLKEGTAIDGAAVLESSDFIGFHYDYNEEAQSYTFIFKLTDDGQEKMTEATAKFAETSGELSLWAGDELIASPWVMSAITGDEFAMTMDLNEEELSDIVDKLGVK